MLGYVVVAQMGNERASWARRARQGRLGAQEPGEVGLTPLVVAIDELGAIGFCASKEKAKS